MLLPTATVFTTLLFAAICSIIAIVAGNLGRTLGHANFLAALGVVALTVLYGSIRYPLDSILRAIIYLNWMCHSGLTKELQKVRLFFHAHTARNIFAPMKCGGNLPGWHVLPAGKVAWIAATKSPMDDSETSGDNAQFHSACDQALAEADRVVIFFHGVGGCRGGVGLPMAAPSGRVTCKRALATHFNCHVVSFEYRGFGDATNYGPSSAAIPSEQSIAEDATTAWEWVNSRVGPKCKVVFYAQSLGCAVALRLASDVVKVTPSIAKRFYLVLDAPFTSLAAAALVHPFGQLTARLLGVVGYDESQKAKIIASILARIPDKWENEERFVTLAEQGVSILSLCKEEDEVVPSSMSRELTNLVSVDGNGSSSPRVAPRLAVIKGRTKVLKRHHIDACTSPEWLTTLGDFLGQI